MEKRKFWLKRKKIANLIKNEILKMIKKIRIKRVADKKPK